MKVLAIPPPTISSSTRDISDSSTVNLVETLEPPTIASIGRSGSVKPLSSSNNSRLNRGPAQADGAYRITPSVDAWARWAVPKASITNMSHKVAMFRAKASSLLFSPALKRTFSHKTTSPGSMSKPPSQFFCNLTGLPSRPDRCSATGAIENSSLY